MCPNFSLDWPPGIYIVHADRHTTLVQALMKMSRVLDHEQDCHTTAVAITASGAFSDVGDWMMNPLSTSTACYRQQFTEIYSIRINNHVFRASPTPTEVQRGGWLARLGYNSYN